MIILQRYLLKTIASRFIGLVGAFFILFAAQQSLQITRHLHQQGIVASSIFHFIVAQLPMILTAIFPLSFYLSLLLTYHHLHQHSELIAMQACSFGGRRLLMTTFYIAFVVATLVACIMLFLNPWLSHYQNKLINQSIQAPFSQIGSDHFFQLPKKAGLLYTKKQEKGKLKNVFFIIPSASHQKKQDFLIAQTAEEHQNKHHQLAIDFHQGSYYHALDHELYDRINFDRYHITLPLSQKNLNCAAYVKSLSNLALLFHHCRQGAFAAAELQWRLALPISVLILTGLAYQFRPSQPRKSTYAMIFPAMLVYTLYMDSLLVIRSWIQKALITPWPGMFLVHGLLLLSLILILAKNKPHDILHALKNKKT